jgi:hypothetical protein
VRTIAAGHVYAAAVVIIGLFVYTGNGRKIAADFAGSLASQRAAGE